MTGWNFGDILEAIEAVLPPDAPAFIHGERRIAWAEARRLSNNLARALVSRGASSGDKIALYMRNRPEYMIALAAGVKARLTHVNVNYRYTPEEVWYILDNADAAVVVYAAEFRSAIEAIRARLTKARVFVEVGPAAGPPTFADAFEDLAGSGDGAPLAIPRSGEDQFFIYTGGTTGLPKGVMWTHADLREITLIAQRRLGAVAETLPELTAQVAAGGPGPRVLPAPPLMHGTGLLTALGAHLAGGCVITLTSPSFDAEELLAAIGHHRPSALSIVGDSFARPMLAALDAAPGRHDLSSLAAITSSGVMWSLEVKRGLLRHMPNVVLNDAFSSSEALGMGASVMTVAGEVPTARFVQGERCMVIDEEGRPIAPGSGAVGRVALGPPNPLGYYKDSEKTARTFQLIRGVRHSIPGDHARVEADGVLTLLGRGSACVNTAGEKVFPEEVEEALKTHPSIEDALVVGMPDARWGEAVTAVIALAAGQALDEAALRRHVRERLAGYKAPKRFVIADRPLRAANGKADYPAARAAAREEPPTAE